MDSGRDKTAQNVRPVAYHEAGHAVATWAMHRELGWQGHPFKRVLIRTPREILNGPFVDDQGTKWNARGLLEGGHKYFPTHHYFVKGITKEIYDQLRIYMEANVVQILAGPLAEARCRRKSPNAMLHGGGLFDAEYARFNIEDFTSNSTETEVLTRELVRRAIDLLSRPSVWRAIVVLAETLIEKHRVEVKEATSIIERAYFARNRQPWQCLVACLKNGCSGIVRLRTRWAVWAETEPKQSSRPWNGCRLSESSSRRLGKESFARKGGGNV